MNDTDCILFIDVEMAKFIIAYKNSTDKTQISEILGASKGQINTLLKRAKKIGIITSHEKISDIAIKCVDALIKKHVDSIK